MAFDFLGTFAPEQLDELEAFLNVKLEDLDSQSNHLIMEAKRVKTLKSKLEQALKNLGASTNNADLLTSSRLESVLGPNRLSYINELFEDRLFEESKLRKSLKSPSGVNDAYRSILMTRLKKPIIPEIKYEREKLEHRIRKCGDLAEQLEEHRMLKLIAKREFDSLLKSIKQLQAADDSQQDGLDISTSS